MFSVYLGKWLTTESVPYVIVTMWLYHPWRVPVTIDTHFYTEQWHSEKAN